MRKYKLNECKFTTIETIEDAYWLGFLVADGNVDQKVKCLTLEISNKDISHLRKFRDFMQSEHPLKITRKECCRISIGSKQLCENLRNFNLTPKKSYFVKTPKIDKDLLSHFYRGVFDGDGWFTHRYYHGKNVTKKPEICFSSALPDFLIEIKKFLNQRINRDVGYLIHRKRVNQSVWELHFGGNNVFTQISSEIYDKSTEYTRLDRKYILYQDYIKYINNKT